MGRGKRLKCTANWLKGIGLGPPESGGTMITLPLVMGRLPPKDKKQLLSNIEAVPNNVIKDSVDANSTRKAHTAYIIVKRNPI